MNASVICPNDECRHQAMIPRTMLGKMLRCPHCERTFVSTETKDSTSKDSKPSAKSSTGEYRTFTNTLNSQIGRFTIKAKLGTGAFGTVFRAYDPQLDREVALKVPNPGSLDSPKRVERFLREAKAAANLRHPHIVPVYDAGMSGGQYYIAAAFIEGKPLSDEIPEHGTAFERAARLVRELAEALAYAHEQGIVHRDVKPANIMVDGQDHIHLMDFGLASRVAEEAKLTNDGAVIGTPGYMSPEQARGETVSVGAASDQYSAGVVLYELLTGSVPFVGAVAAVVHHVIHSEPEPPEARRAKVPADLSTICRKSIAKRVEDRYADCQSLADDLRRWMEGEPIAAREQTRFEKAVTWVRRKPTQAGLIVSAMAAVVMLGFGVTMYMLASEARERKATAEKDSEYATAALRDAEKKADDIVADAEKRKVKAERDVITANAAFLSIKSETTKLQEALVTARVEIEAIQKKSATAFADQSRFQELSEKERKRVQEYAKVIENGEINRESDFTSIANWEWKYMKAKRSKPVGLSSASTDLKITLDSPVNKCTVGNNCESICYTQGDRVFTGRSVEFNRTILESGFGRVHSVQANDDHTVAIITFGEAQVRYCHLAKKTHIDSSFSRDVDDLRVCLAPRKGHRLFYGNQLTPVIFEQSATRFGESEALLAFRLSPDPKTTYFTFSHEGDRIAASNGGEVTVWDMNGKNVSHFSSGAAFVRDVAFGLSSQDIFVLSIDNVVTHWVVDGMSCTRKATVKLDVTNRTFHGRFCFQSQRILVSDESGYVSLYETQTGVRVCRLGIKRNQPVSTSAISSDGRTIMLGHPFGYELYSYDPAFFDKPK